MAAKAPATDFGLELADTFRVCTTVSPPLSFSFPGAHSRSLAVRSSFPHLSPLLLQAYTLFIGRKTQLLSKYVSRCECFFSTPEVDFSSWQRNQINFPIRKD